MIIGCIIVSHDVSCILKKPSPNHPISHICIWWQLLPPSSGRYRHYVTISDRGQSPWRSPHDLPQIPSGICYASAQEEWYGRNLDLDGFMIFMGQIWALALEWFWICLGPLALGFLTAPLTWNWNAWGKWHHREPNGSRHCLHVSTWQPWDQSSQIRIETKITNITNKTKSMSQLFNLNPNYPTYFVILFRSPPF